MLGADRAPLAHERAAARAGSRNEWHGTVDGDAIEGGFTWTLPGKPPVESWFRGRCARP